MLTKRTYINLLKGAAILLILLCIPKACVEFRISEQEALEEFNNSLVKPSFGDLQIGDRSIHYTFTDQKRDAIIVFIHGSPGSWNAFIDYFKSDSLLAIADILAIDRPGYGGSDFGDAEPSLETQAHLLNKVIERFSHEKKILVGHSLGGPVIARLAMDYPTHFDGLLFIAPSIDPSLEKEEWYRGILNSEIGRMFTPIEMRVSNDEIMPLKTELEKMLPMWKQIRTKSVVIQGTEDWLVPAENAAFAKSMLHDSIVSIQMMTGENHFIPWSKKGVIIEAIYQMVEPQ